MLTRFKTRSSQALGPAALLLVALLALGHGLAEAAIVFDRTRTVPVDRVMRAEASWAAKGSRTVKAGALTLDEGPVDTVESSVVDLVLTSTEAGRPVGAAFTVREQVERDGAKADSLALDGLAVLAAWDGDEWDLKRADGKRLTRAQQRWLRAHADDLGDDDEDPLYLLLPPGPVGPGDTWTIPIPDIAARLGRPGLELDPATSFAKVTFLGTTMVGGAEGAQLGFDVHLVPLKIQKGTIRRGAFDIRGTAELPFAGSEPWLVLAATVELTFDGTVRRGPLEVDVVMDIATQVRASRLPVP